MELSKKSISKQLLTIAKRDDITVSGYIDREENSNQEISFIVGDVENDLFFSAYVHFTNSKSVGDPDENQSEVDVDCGTEVEFLELVDVEGYEIFDFDELEDWSEIETLVISKMIGPATKARTSVYG